MDTLDGPQWGQDAVMTGSETPQVAVEVAPNREPPGRFGFYGIAFLLVLLLGIAVPIALLIWQAVTTTMAVRSGDAGSFVSATAVQGGFFTSALTTVQTSEGSVTVRGIFSAPRGRALAVEDLNKTGLHLCAVGDLGTCLPLAGHWAGILIATPEAGRAFDFERYGLSNDNLKRWMMAGLIFCFIGLVWLIAIEIGRRS